MNYDHVCWVTLCSLRRVDRKHTSETTTLLGDVVHYYHIPGSDDDLAYLLEFWKPEHVVNEIIHEKATKPI